MSLVPARINHRFRFPAQSASGRKQIQHLRRGLPADAAIHVRPDVIALKPKAVLILAGTNDIAGNTGPMTIEKPKAT